MCRIILDVSSILLIGSNGQLGTDLRNSSADRSVTSITRGELDIRDDRRIAEVLDETRPDVIVNTAAFVNVDECEIHEEMAYAINSKAVMHLATQSERIGARLVHISTDYVFDGSRRESYPEDAPTRPVNVYGKSKLKGEQHVRTICRRHLIVRSSGLYGVAGSSGKGGNFVRTMLRLGREKGEVSVVTDQVLTPTNTDDLARALWGLIDREAQGVFHVTNSGSCSWFEFARAIFELRGMDVAMHPIDSATLGYRARRPAYSVLDNGKLVQSGYAEMRPWRDALAGHLESLGSVT
jgi:dTDP-4-dehydrorhamnose reductase